MTSRQDAQAPEQSDDESVGGHRPSDLIAGKYCLRHVLGIGGMGTVWAATNLDLDLDVAVKVINKGLCSDETRARLATEARAEAKVQHRGIVRVLDLGVTDAGEPFLVMERLEGRSLGDLLEEVGHLESVDAVRMMLPVIEALDYAHGRGVIHRDLKPDNIFLAEHCGKTQPKLVDFGIAKLGDVPLDLRHTGRGAVVGSPGYMAPEHARGVDVDHRADIFCASLVLYEAISGVSAFRGSNYNALLRAVIEQDLQPITAHGRGDTELSRILERGLHKNPARRHASCLELGQALATWLMAHGETDDVTGEPLTSWWQRGPSEGVVRTTSSNHRAVRVHTPSRAPTNGHRTGRPGTGLKSLRGVSLSTSGFAAVRPPPRRRAFIALAVFGFAGGLAATAAFDLVPWHTSTSSGMSVAAASTATRAVEPGTAVTNAPTVTPVENALEPAHVPETVSGHALAATTVTRNTPRAESIAMRYRGTTLPTPKAPPSFPAFEESHTSEPAAPPAPATSPAPPVTPPAPVAVAHPAPAASEPPLMAPPEPPPRASNPYDTELKDPYQ